MARPPAIETKASVAHRSVDRTATDEYESEALIALHSSMDECGDQNGEDAARGRGTTLDDPSSNSVLPTVIAICCAFETPRTYDAIMHIAIASTPEQIAATYDVMAQLRPHIARDEYVPFVQRLIANERFSLAALSDDSVVRAVAGYRMMEMLYCGRMMYIDDLVTDERVRSRGYGKALIDWLKTEARQLACTEVQLISRVTREEAHRFYFRESFGIEAFHFRAKL